MGNEFLTRCERKQLVQPILMRLGVTCAVLLAMGWFFLKIAQSYGATRLADDGNEFAGPAVGFLLLLTWCGAAYLCVKGFADWLHYEREPRKDGITQLVIYTQHLEAIYKHFMKTYRWTDFKEHAYIEYIFNGHHFALHLTAIDGTYIMLDDGTYEGGEQGVGYLNTVIPKAILPGLLDAIHNGNSVQVFLYTLDAQGLSGEGKTFQWSDLIALHVKPWRDCELIFQNKVGNLDSLNLECQGTNVFIAPDLIREIMSENKRDIEIIVD